MTPITSQTNPPRDPYNLVYILLYWLGIGTLLPWNFFLAANGYWMYKFREVSTNSANISTLKNAEINQGDPSRLSELQLTWGPYMSMAAMIPNVSVLLINAIYGHQFKVNVLIITSLVLIIVTFSITSAMTQINTDSWQSLFMGLTLLSVIAFNVLVALLQGGLFGTVGRFPSTYMGALVQGQALGGIIAVGFNVMLLIAGLDSVSAAFYDFNIAIIYLATALIAFFAVLETDFYRFYAEGHLPDDDGQEDSTHPLMENHKSLRSIIDEVHIEKTSSNILAVSSQIWIWLMAAFISFFCTLTVFPSITQLAFSTQYDEGSAWATIYFVPVGCFLVFNMGDFVGRLLASWIKFPGPTNRGGFIALSLACGRLVFIPLFMLCNVSPQNRSVTQVYIKSDVAYLTLMVLFALSHGYMGNVCLSFAPKMLDKPSEQGQAASLMVFFIVFGLAVGSTVSSICVGLL